MPEMPGDYPEGSPLVPELRSGAVVTRSLRGELGWKAWRSLTMDEETVDQENGEREIYVMRYWLRWHP